MCIYICYVRENIQNIAHCHIVIYSVLSLLLYYLIVLIKRTIILLGASFKLVITLFMPQYIGPLNRQSVQAERDGQSRHAREKDVFALPSLIRLISNFAIIYY